MSEFRVEIDREGDGRWIAEIRELPGVVAYGATRDEAILAAQALAFRVLADRIEHGEEIPQVSESSRSPNDAVAFDESEACPCRASADRLANQA
ncbi:MAG TPA: type II toxin-antitoxin system HicB family antitoxin [Thermoanaerobaculia bacterium]